MVEPRRRKVGKEHERKDCGASLAIGFGHECTRIDTDDCCALLAIVEPRRRKGGKKHEEKDCGASLAIGFGHECTPINTKGCNKKIKL
jgi:hypothetical protein